MDCESLKREQNFIRIIKKVVGYYNIALRK